MDQETKEMTGPERKKAFDAAKKAALDGNPKLARELVKHNHESDRRIIERHISEHGEKDEHADAS